jgi:hypothetical protein
LRSSFAKAANGATDPDCRESGPSRPLSGALRLVKRVRT